MKKNKPVRIQRSRKTKQVSPNGLPIVYAGRPSILGNPFKLIDDMIYIDAGYRRKALNKWVFLCQGDVDKVILLYQQVVNGFVPFFENNINLKSEEDVDYWISHFRSIDFSKFKNKNISCWCSMDKPCHVDVVLEMVNYNLDQ